MALLYFQQVSAVYAITWFPVLIIYMLNYYYKDQHYGNVTYVIAIVIVTFNSCVNPFVYAFCNGRFRSHLKKLFAFTCHSDFTWTELPPFGNLLFPKGLGPNSGANGDCM